MSQDITAGSECVHVFVHFSVCVHLCLCVCEAFCQTITFYAEDEVCPLIENARTHARTRTHEPTNARTLQLAAGQQVNHSSKLDTSPSQHLADPETENNLPDFLTKNVGTQLESFNKPKHDVLLDLA